ncbi:MAG: N-acetylmuramoyl-L-alanine amidase-like domain-containing protein, partial [Gemmatimonadales bacterium]
MLLSRRTLIRCLAATGAAAAFPALAGGRGLSDPDRERLSAWTGALRTEGLALPGSDIGRAAARVGELAAGSPYKPSTLEEYLLAGGNPAREPLTLSLTQFDCVTLVESCLAVARAAAGRTEPTWGDFGAGVEKMRYRNGTRSGYASRLHYFSEWISDGESRGMVRDLGRELGGRADLRPLRFMTMHRESYP